MVRERTAVWVGQRVGGRGGGVKDTGREHRLMGMGGGRGSSMGPVLGQREPGKMMVPDEEMEGK